MVFPLFSYESHQMSWLVGGEWLPSILYFPGNIGNHHHPSWRTPSFFRWVAHQPDDVMTHGIGQRMGARQVIMKSHWNPMKSHWNPMKSHEIPWNPMKFPVFLSQIITNHHKSSQIITNHHKSSQIPWTCPVLLLFAPPRLLIPGEVIHLYRRNGALSEGWCLEIWENHGGKSWEKHWWDLNGFFELHKSSWLVVWLQFFIFPKILGISSSQLTNSIIFQRGGLTTNQIIMVP